MVKLSRTFSHLLCLSLCVCLSVCLSVSLSLCLSLSLSLSAICFGYTHTWCWCMCVFRVFCYVHEWKIWLNRKVIKAVSVIFACHLHLCACAYIFLTICNETICISLRTTGISERRISAQRTCSHFSDTLVSSMLSSPGRATQLEALPPLDEASQVLSATVLTCLAHYFSWAPLSATLTPQLLSTIFHFAAFGCEGKAGRTGVASTSPGV